ncbi:MAG TPA: hypothetical protein VJ746_05300 [Nitrospira sp.]|nr:hypothetical protein [Nitrospira sp.]
MSVRSSVVPILAIVLSGHVIMACSQLDPAGSMLLEPVPITEIKSVAGTWEGLVVRTPADRREDWVTLRIQDDGTYRFEAFRTIGVFSGTGRFELQDGKLSTKSERGSMSLQLQRHPGKDDRILKAQGQTADGLQYSSSLTPKAKRP